MAEENVGNVETQAAVEAPQGEVKAPEGQLSEQQLSEKALENLGQQAQTASQKLNQGVDQAAFNHLQNQVRSQESLINKWKNEMGQYRKSQQQLVDSGYVDQGTEQPQQTVTQTDPAILQELQSIKQMQQQQTQQSQYDTAFNDARNLQAVDPIFATQDDIKNIASNPMHQEYAKYKNLESLDTIRSQRGWSGLSLQQTWHLVKNETGQAANEMQQVKLQARQDLVQGIQKQQAGPNTLGDAAHEQVEGQLTQQVKSRADYNKLSRDQKLSLEKEAMADLVAEEKALGY